MVRLSILFELCIEFNEDRYIYWIMLLYSLLAEFCFSFITSILLSKCFAEHPT